MRFWERKLHFTFLLFTSELLRKDLIEKIADYNIIINVN